MVKLIAKFTPFMELLLISFSQMLIRFIQKRPHINEAFLL